MSRYKFPIFAAVVSGFSVFLNSYAVKVWPNPFLFTAAKNIIVAFLLFGLVIYLGKWEKIKALTKKDFLSLFLLGLIGGGIPFLLFFKGLSLSASTAVNGAFIQKTMFVWVAIMSFVILKEKLEALQVVGLATILFGIFINGGIKSFSFGAGEIYVLIATILWSIEALYVHKVTKNIDPELAALGRMAFGVFFMIDYLLFFTPKMPHLTGSHFGWLAVTSLFLVSYVLLFYKSLATLRATTVTSLLTVAFPITVILSSLQKGIFLQRSTYSIVIIFIGILIIFYQITRDKMWMA